MRLARNSDQNHDEFDTCRIKCHLVGNGVNTLKNHDSNDLNHFTANEKKAERIP